MSHGLWHQELWGCMGIGFISWESPLATQQCSLTEQVNTQRYCEEVRRETEGGVGQGSCTV